MNFYLLPCGDENPAGAIYVANSIERLLYLINNDLLDTENNYILTEVQLEELTK